MRPAMPISPKPVKHPPIVTGDEAEALLSRLLEIIPALMAIIEQETALVRAGRLIEATRLEPRKAQLSVVYLSEAARVKASCHYLNQHLSARCRELRRKHDELHALLRINLTVLATAHAVSEDLRHVRPNGRTTPEYGPASRHQPCALTSRFSAFCCDQYTSLAQRRPRS